MKQRIALVIVLVSLLMFSIATPVLAIAQPTSASVNAVYAYDNCLEDGDLGILVDYTINYGVLPTETANAAYLTVFIDTDGTTQLKSVAPYVFQNSGYDRGLTWIYFSAAEVTTYSIDAADIALYSVWLVGNPTLTWVAPATPPQVIVNIDSWSTITEPATLIALRVLYYAGVLESAWTLDMIEVTSLGNKLTTLGASYFENVIVSLRTIAPACFSSTSVPPNINDITYSTSFGAIATSTVLVGSPVTLVEGANALNPTGAGTISFVLSKGTRGTAVGAVVAGTPLALVAGTNTATITGAGAITVTVNLVNLSTTMEGAVLGTGWDVSAAATAFGMSRWMFGGIIWLILSVIICAAVYGTASKAGYQLDMQGGSKVIMIMMNLCVIGGTILGLLHPIVGIVLFIGFMSFTAYILIFRGANF